MAQSQLALYNLALATSGSKSTLTSVAQQSVEAEMCTLFYENVRQVALRAAHWNSAKRFVRLTEEAERDTAEPWAATDPEPGYAFSYELPSNYLFARYLTTFDMFEIGYETDQKILSCNIGGDNSPDDQPILCYTIDVTDVTLWEPDLYMAMYHALAAHIAMPLHAKASRARDNLLTANEILQAARAANANERHVMFDREPDSLNVRGYSYRAITPYFYPYGSLYTAPGAPLI